VANHKRKHRKWQKLCMCKVGIGKGIGNHKSRRPARDLRQLQEPAQ
jgi:hypothetical protein